MAAIVPGRGWCCFIRDVADQKAWGLLGPFSEGSFLRRLLLQVTGSGTFTANLGAVLGPSGEATEVAFRAGKTLIDRSTEQFFGAPMVTVDAVAGVGGRVLLSPGVKIHSGSRYCVVHFGYTGEAARAGLVATAEVLEKGKGPKEAPGQ